ncbi:reticulon-3 isoform X2 [Anguilla anguilla]|uniref:reticulon-3 isoform X2 n=1 Tax=Anguilla anguilla TaxID=7936 RepID=UPI0015AE75B5|nr:reticulon-3 isoform X2 [Anguilla anguilla]
MADPMTQSAQISSSEGLVDGKNSSSSSKDSKFSDSFLSSSPVSLIQSPQASAPASTAADHYVKDQSKKVEVHGFASSSVGRSNVVPQGFPGGTSSNPATLDQDSPVVTSPVSERIKALEALAAKQSDGDTWNDGGFLLFKERHYEKTQTDVKVEFSTATQMKEATPGQDSPESPFEVLGDTKQGGEFEDTMDWMRAHLPPAPDFGSGIPDPKVGKEASDFPSVSPRSGEAVASAGVIEVGVPDAFMDSPTGASKPTGPFIVPGKQSSVEDDSEFDLRFLPTAYVWEKPEKIAEELQGPPSHAIVQEQEPPAPPAGFDSPPPPSPPTSQLTATEVKYTPLGDGFEPAEILDVDSSGESEDTVTEDTAPVSALASSATSTEVASAAPSPPTDGKETQLTKAEHSLPAQPEKQTILVPIINVIETEEQVCSDDEVEQVEEDEGYPVVDDPVKEGPQHTDQKPEVPESAARDHTAPVSEVALGPSDICTFDATSQEDSPPASMTHTDAKTSPQHQSAKEESHVSRPPSAVPAARSEDTAQDSPASKEPELDALQGEPLTSEKMQIQNEPPAKSSIQAAETADEKIAERLTDPVDHFETQPGFLDSCSNDEAAQHASSDLPTSLTEKPINDSIKEDVLQFSSPLVEPSRALGSSEANEYVQLTAEKSVTETPAAMQEGKSVDKHYNLDTETKIGSSDSQPQSHIEPMVPQMNVSSENATAMTLTDLGDVGAKDSEEPHPKPVGGQPSPRDFNQDPFSCLWSEPQDVTQKVLESNMDASDEITSEVKSLHNESASKSVTDVSPHTESGMMARVVETKADENSPETTSDPESIEPECSVTAATDSFVEFMRECLKSRQGEEEPEELSHHLGDEHKSPKMGVPYSKSPPAIAFDVEQEHLTIRALKELGDSQEEEEQDKVLPQFASKTQTPVGPTPLPPSPPCEPPCEMSASKMAEEVDMWVAEAYHLAEHVLAAVLTHLSVRDLVYWRDPKKSGVVFGTSLLLLLSLAAFSVISVASYLLLALLCVTIAFRVYKSVVQAVQKSGDGHPFKELMDKDVSIAPETFRKHVDSCLSHVNRALKHLSRLFLVEDLVDSLKLAVLMWLMTYVGAVFNGITILILADVLLFTVPLVYEKNKTQIDHYIDVVRTQFNTIVSKLQEKLPGAAKRSKVE